MRDPALDGARCDLCPIFLAGHKNPVPPAEVDPAKLRLIIVGEAPGRKEVAVGTPFVGPSGRFLDQMFEDAGERRFRSFSHLDNSAHCRSESDKDNEIASLCCAPALLKRLVALPADVPIMACGKTAAKSILFRNGILTNRGFVWVAKEISEDVIAAAHKRAIKTTDPIDALKSETLRLRAQLAGRIVFPVLHPAFILRSDTWKPILQIDVRRVMRFLRKEFTLKDIPMVESYEVVTTLKEAKIALDKLGDVLNFDIETEGINPLKTPIRCVGIGDLKHIVVIGGARENEESSKRWDHKKFAPLLTERFRRAKELVGHNIMNFDVIALERDGVVFEKEKLCDTLIAHKSFAPHLPQRMDQVVSELMDSLPWKVVFGRRGAEEKGLAPHQMSPKELYFYNASDCYRQARIWPAMQADLESERGVYEHDMQLAQISKQMQVDGICVDIDRRNEIASKMKHRAAALKGQMRTLTRKRTFSPSRLNDVRKALFHTFGAPVLYATPGGDPSTSSLTLEALKSQDTRAGRLADLIIKWRVVSKIKSTYLDAIETDNSRSHFVWRIFGTVSGRWSCRLQSIPRWVDPKKKDASVEDRIREIYVASPGYDLHYFDLSQSEMRAAAWLSGDTAFMKTCEGDVHAGNARILFPKIKNFDDKEMKETGKRFRDVAKNAGFGILYSAEIETIFKFLQSKGFSEITLNAVSAMFNIVRRTYAEYYRYCERNLLHCQRHGFLRTALMKRIRWIGWFPKPGDPYNFMIQSFIADLMNMRLLELHPRLPRGARVLAQIHDALIIEAPRGNASRLLGQEIKEVWAAPVLIPGTDRSFVMPVDQKLGDRWSQFG